MDAKTLEGGRFFMKLKENSHYSKEEWVLYYLEDIHKDQLIQMENHLYSCDQCLEQYMTVIEKIEVLPKLKNENKFTDSIMGQIFELEKVELKKHPSTNFHKQTVFNYLLAAGLTILLMMTGLFEKISAETIQFNEQKIYHNESFTENLMYKTGTFIDQIKKTYEEANK